MLVLVGLFFLWRARRARANKKKQPFSFDTTLSELRNRGFGDNALEDRPREMKRNAIKLLNNIGEGAFGTVYKGLVDERSTTGVPEYTVAVKVLKNEPTGSEIKEFMREAAIMAQFKYPNVLSLVGVCTAGEPAMIVLQFCEHGSLLSFLKKHTGFQQLQLASKLSILADVAGGMTYLASCNVVHRDLATRNVLVGSDFGCKVSDFGLSREMESGSADYYASPKGMLPLRWTAPEALKTRHFATASDVWSFGITCGEVFDDGELVCERVCGVCFLERWLLIGLFVFPKQPFATWENEQVWIHIQNGKAIDCPVSCPMQVFQAVISPCFAVGPAVRPSFSVLHQSLRSLADNAAASSAVFAGAAAVSSNPPLANPTGILDLTSNGAGYILPTAAAATAAAAAAAAAATTTSTTATTAEARAEQQLRLQYLSEQPPSLFSNAPSQPHSQQVSLSYLQQSQAPLFKEAEGKLPPDGVQFPALSTAQSAAKKTPKFANYPQGLPPNLDVGMFQNPLYTFQTHQPRDDASMLLNMPVYPDEHA
jgi:serine/threonine protein kinase